MSIEETSVQSPLETSVAENGQNRFVRLVAAVNTYQQAKTELVSAETFHRSSQSRVDQAERNMKRASQMLAESISESHAAVELAGVDATIDGFDRELGAALETGVPGFGEHVSRDYAGRRDKNAAALAATLEKRGHLPCTLEEAAKRNKERSGQ